MARRRVEGTSWSLIAGVAVAGLLIGYLIGTAGSDGVDMAPQAASPPVEPPAPAVAEVPAVMTTDPGPESAMPEPDPATAPGTAPPVDLGPMPRGGGSRIALVIDDLGRSLVEVAELADLGVPLSFGVLPFESRTTEVVDELARRGGEVLLHLPMEPNSSADPGPGALTSGMSASELEAATRWALGAVGSAIGVNNHMGSGLSADSQSMRTILQVIGERDLFFLDSRTSPKSVGYSLALEMGLAAVERHVFLDAEVGPDAIRVQFRRLLEVASQRGSAVAIGHPHAVTIGVLREEIPRAIDAGFEFVRVSSLARRSAAPGQLAR